MAYVVISSVERVVEYLDLPQEPPAIIESSRPPAYWPSSSSSNENSLISVENLVIKYAPELPPVLHDVSFTLKAKERIGLLGRTGSGKSTLAMSVLRFVRCCVGLSNDWYCLLICVNRLILPAVVLSLMASTYRKLDYMIFDRELYVFP
jgi:hypothetical protein